MAHIRKLPSGKYKATVSLPGGRQTTKTHPLRKVVADWAREVEVERDRGFAPNRRAGRTTFAQWWEQWIASRVVEPRTLSDYKGCYAKHLAGPWGDKHLAALSKLEVEGWLRRELAAGMGPRTAGKCLMLINAALNAAVADRLIPANPVKGVKPPRLAEQPVRFLDEQQEADLIACMSEEDGAFVQLLLDTGMRWGEAAGLRRENLDHPNRLIHVVGVIVRDSNAYREYPKSKRSRRAVPMPEWFGWVGEDPTPGLIFPGLEYSAWRKDVWVPAVRLAKLPAWATPHVTRHTYASRLVQAGVPIYTVQAVMGHESVATTMRYAHLAPASFDAVREAIARQK